MSLKGLSHEMDFGFWWHVWLVLGLNRGQDYFYKFLGAPMILKRKKWISHG
jgi:hypothetical protein